MGKTGQTHGANWANPWGKLAEPMGEIGVCHVFPGLSSHVSAPIPNFATSPMKKKAANGTKDVCVVYVNYPSGILLRPSSFDVVDAMAVLSLESYFANINMKLTFALIPKTKHETTILQSRDRWLPEFQESKREKIYAYLMLGGPPIFLRAAELSRPLARF